MNQQFFPVSSISPCPQRFVKPDIALEKAKVLEVIQDIFGSLLLNQDQSPKNSKEFRSLLENRFVNPILFYSQGSCCKKDFDFPRALAALYEYVSSKKKVTEVVAEFGGLDSHKIRFYKNAFLDPSMLDPSMRETLERLVEKSKLEDQKNESFSKDLSSEELAIFEKCDSFFDSYSNQNRETVLSTTFEECSSRPSSSITFGESFSRSSSSILVQPLQNCSLEGVYASDPFFVSSEKDTLLEKSSYPGENSLEDPDLDQLILESLIDEESRSSKKARFLESNSELSPDSAHFFDSFFDEGREIDLLSGSLDEDKGEPFQKKVSKKRTTPPKMVKMTPEEKQPKDSGSVKAPFCEENSLQTGFKNKFLEFENKPLRTVGELVAERERLKAENPGFFLSDSSLRNQKTDGYFS